MDKQGKRKPGRPRGSGETAEINGIPVTPDELIPFITGRRLYCLNPGIQGDDPVDLAELSPWLNPAERRHLQKVPDRMFQSWFAAGYIYQALIATIEEARAG